MKQLAILVLTTAILAGCTGISELSDDRNYPRRVLLPEQKAKIEEVEKAGLLELGMTEDEVISLIGPPQAKGYELGGKIHWRYTSHSAFYDNFHGASRPFVVIFQNHEVVWFGRLQSNYK